MGEKGDTSAEEIRRREIVAAELVDVASRTERLESKLVEAWKDERQETHAGITSSRANAMLALFSADELQRLVAAESFLFCWELTDDDLSELHERLLNGSACSRDPHWLQTIKLAVGRAVARGTTTAAASTANIFETINLNLGATNGTAKLHDWATTAGVA